MGSIQIKGPPPIKEYKDYIVLYTGLPEIPEVILVPQRSVDLKTAKFEYNLSGELR